MAKGSYLKKYREKTGDRSQSERTQIIISDEMRQQFEEGQVILIDEPLHWTSFDIVRKIRNVLRIKKVGHAGTLDPLATGLLIICTGKYTKKINQYMAEEKEYTGTFTLGAVTPTYDLESDPGSHKDISHITDMDIRAAAARLTGNIQQLPPVYSAIKKNGTALYELARRGEEVELQPRAVTVSLFEVMEISKPLVHFRIVCSTGTYIRSIANDLGSLLGCGAYLSLLRRTRIGEQRTEDAAAIDEFMKGLESNEMKGVIRKDN